MLPPSRPRWTPLGRSLLLLAMGCLLLIRDAPAPLDVQAAFRLPPAAVTVPAAPPLPDLSALPLAFEPNVGQADPAARFMAHTGTGALLFTPGSVVLVPAAPTPVPTAAGVTFRHTPDLPAPPPPRPPAQRVSLRWVGANAAPTLVGGTRLPGLINYLHGNDPAHWQTAVPTYSALTYQGLYPGIDLQYNGGVGGLKGTYSVAPGADPTRIRWRYEGADPPRVDAHGDLHLRVPAPAGSSPNAAAPAILTEQAPLAWQEQAGRRVPVATRFTVAADGSIGFAVSAYDHSAALTLDPYLLYSATLGAGASYGHGVAVDSTGAAYFTGLVEGYGYPTVDPFQPSFGGGYDAFVTKLNPTGTALVYSTYLGGDGLDYAGTIAVDAAGQAYIVGSTGSGNFPLARAYQTVNPGLRACFLTVLTAQGSGLVYSTFFGGRHSDNGWGIAVTPAGAATITGYAQSDNFPTYHALYTGGTDQAFVAGFTPMGELVYSTLLPGTFQGLSVALDAVGNTYVTGVSHGPGLPALYAVQPSYGGGSQDGFIVALAPNGAALRYGSYIGGSGDDEGTGIAVDAQGQATVTGATTSANLLPPVGPLLPTPPLQAALNGPSDAFVLRYSAAGSQLRYGTYFGGSGGEEGLGVAVDSSGAGYVVGQTNSGDLPVGHAAQWTSGGATDGFVTKLNSAGTALAYSTYLGGRSDDLCQAVVVDGMGTAYVTGVTHSDNFPLVRSFVQGAGFYMVALGDSCPLQFNDVPAGSTFAGYIGCLACRGIVSGYSDGTYQPGASLTRGQLAKIVAGAAVLTATIPLTQQTFTDVPPSATFWRYIEQAAGAGIVSGYTCGTGPAEPCDAQQRPYYRPGVGVTRGQTAKLVSQGAGWTDPIPPAQQTFSDVRPGDTFWGAIEQAAAHGSIAGYTCGPGGPGPCDSQRRPYYLPGAGVTRGQAAKIVGNSFFPNCETRPPTATPLPSVTATPPAPSVTATPTATAGVAASATATVPVAATSATVTATATPTPSGTATGTATPPGSSPTPTPSPPALVR